MEGGSSTFSSAVCWCQKKCSHLPPIEEDHWNHQTVKNLTSCTWAEWSYRQPGDVRGRHTHAACAGRQVQNRWSCPGPFFRSPHPTVQLLQFWTHVKRGLCIKKLLPYRTLLLFRVQLAKMLKLHGLTAAFFGFFIDCLGLQFLQLVNQKLKLQLLLPILLINLHEFFKHKL